MTIAARLQNLACRGLSVLMAFAFATWCGNLGAVGADDVPGGVPPDGLTGNNVSRAEVVHLIQIPLPIVGDTDSRVQGMIEQILQREEFRSRRENEDRADDRRRRTTLILEFRGDDRPATATSQFERSLSLARFLASQRVARLRTVAFITGAIHGHAVLPVLACDQIVAHPDAELGKAGVNEPFIDATIRSGYQEITRRRRTVPEPVAVGLLDSSATVIKAETIDGVRYVLESELEALKEEVAVQSTEQVIPQGEFGTFSGSELRLKYAFASHLARNRKELAAALGFAPTSIEEDPTLADGRRPLRVDVSGPIKPETVAWVERSVRASIEDDGVNFVCLVINSPGGAALHSVRLATFLAGLDSGKVRTVAFVGQEARADAAFIALACDRLVMTADAVLGGPGAERFSDRKLNDLEAPLRKIAAAKQRDWSFIMAMVSPSLAVRRYQHSETGQQRLLSEKELSEQENSDRWIAGEPIDVSGGIRGNAAAEAGIVRMLVKDFVELRQFYQLDEKVPTVRATWAHRLVEFLAAPHVSGTLLFIGWFALMVEFMSPGLSVSGFVSGLCFLLFFWANTLNGTAGWLEILLFAAGLGCIALEIFVLPGFGIFGIGGGVLLIASLVLASQTFVIPQNAYELRQVPTSLFMVAAAGVGAFSSLFFMRRLVADSPLFRRVALEPADTQQQDEREYREALVHFEYLHGKRGRTTTQLTPSGKARFGDEIIDVVSEGDVVPLGADVCVAYVRGNEVVVRLINDPTTV